MKIKGWVIVHRSYYWNGMEPVIKCSDVFLKKPDIGNATDVQIIELEVEMPEEKK